MPITSRIRQRQQWLSFWNERKLTSTPPFQHERLPPRIKQIRKLDSQPFSLYIPQCSINRPKETKHERNEKEKHNSRNYFEAAAPTSVEPIASRYANGEYRLVNVFVEGYDDVAFWRGIFDDYETDRLKFEISVPPRKDLAKGKRVLLDMIPESGPNLLLCMDSDFDYLFNGNTEQSRLVNDSPYVFHTYAYATENYLCHPPSLHRVCAKATKNDTLIFDFETFLKEYSRIIYPLFLWYAYSAMRKSERIFR